MTKKLARKAAQAYESENEFEDSTLKEGDAPPAKKVKIKKTTKSAPLAEPDTSKKRGKKKGAQNAKPDKTKKLAPAQAKKKVKEPVSQSEDKCTTFLSRASKERMFVINRSHADHTDCPKEKVQLAGSKGNVYTITITHKPTCTCPQFIYHRDDGPCKHILYVLHFVLKVQDMPASQRSFQTHELQDLFAKAPAFAHDSETDGKRKPLDHDCPICFTEHDHGEDIVWCRAACGNNMHNACLDKWAKAKAGNPTCPCCRAEWQFEEKNATTVHKVNMNKKSSNGYFDVKDQLDYDD